MLSFLYLQVYNSPTTPVLENPEYQTRWYFKYFLGKRKSMLFDHYKSIEVDWIAA